jgi:hypothetical protein
MRLCLWTQMEDLGRMEGRVIQLLDRIQATIVTISMVKLDEHVLLSGVIDAEEIQAARLEALLWKIEGMRSVKVVSEMSTTQRMIG